MSLGLSVMVTVTTPKSPNSQGATRFSFDKIDPFSGAPFPCRKDRPGGTFAPDSSRLEKPGTRLPSFLGSAKTPFLSCRADFGSLKSVQRWGEPFFAFQRSPAGEKSDFLLQKMALHHAPGLFFLPQHGLPHDRSVGSAKKVFARAERHFAATKNPPHYGRSLSWRQYNPLHHRNSIFLRQKAAMFHAQGHQFKRFRSTNTWNDKINK
jgi:hypothetical protein